MKIKKRYILLGCIVVLLPFIWGNNTSLFCDKSGEYNFLAHRGLAQTFDVSQVEWDTNTAEIIDEPEHPYLENTLESMKAAFENGAQCVELDIQLTKDGYLAIFHDDDLSMRTDGEGTVAEWTMEELKQLDVGYGYTADGGKTYPFRGKGVGLMPELKEVLEAFPDQELLIHMNHGDVKTAEVLWTYLKDMPEERLQQLTFYGNDDGLDYLREQNDTIRVLSASRLKEALIKYELLGWTGYIPDEIKNMEIHIPLKYAKFLWGWPNKFVERMDSVNTKVVIVEGNGKWSEGFDTKESLENIPEGYSGYVWTNRIDKVTDLDEIELGSNAKEMEKNYRQITQEEAKEMMDTKDVLILDVREQDEYESAHIPNAILLPVGSIDENTAAETIPEKDTTVLVYCRSGNRSKTASAMLAELGYTNIYEFGGINTWQYGTEK